MQNERHKLLYQRVDLSHVQEMLVMSVILLDIGDLNQHLLFFAVKKYICGRRRYSLILIYISIGFILIAQWKGGVHQVQSITLDDFYTSAL